MGKTSKVYGVDYTVVRTNVSLETPYLLRQAAERLGFPSSSALMRHLIAKVEAETLGEDYDALMAEMPPDWDRCRGAARPRAASLSGKSSE